MPTVRVGDISMHYVEAGAGEPLVLIMGLGGDHLAWGFQLPTFAQSYRVIAFDNRGVGQTDAPDHSYTTAMMADDTARLMDALGIASAHVLGVSMGGMIAQELALHHPARVRTLQLHCTFARPDRHVLALLASWREVRARLSWEMALRTMALWLFSPFTYNERPDFVEAVLETVLANPHPQSHTGFRRQSEAVEHHDALDRLGAITCPTLVTAASEDILVAPQRSRLVAERIPGAEFREIAGGGHAYFWEQAEEFNEVALRFIGAHRLVGPR